MAESGIVFRYVFNNTEYDTYEEAKARAESTVGGGHIYKRMKNISINQIKHWDYMQNPATYENWEYVVGNDEDMGYVAYITPYLIFKLIDTDDEQYQGKYTYINIYRTSEKVNPERINLNSTFTVKKDESFSFEAPEIVEYGYGEPTIGHDTTTNFMYVSKTFEGTGDYLATVQDIRNKGTFAYDLPYAKLTEESFNKFSSKSTVTMKLIY